MVEDLKPKHLLGLTEFVKENKDTDFYVTENNSRVIIEDATSLKKLLKQSNSVRIIEERGDVLGIILLWKSIGNVTRYYVKLNAINEDIADRLLTVLIWNERKELYTKIKKTSKFVKVFKNKGFDFLGDRGQEILLKNNNKYRKTDDKHNQQNQESDTR